VAQFRYFGTTISQNPIQEEIKKKLRPLGRPRHRGLDNIKVNFGKIGWDGVDWTDLAQDEDRWRGSVNTTMNPRVPKNSRKF
jgi:hypothetical protein